VSRNHSRGRPKKLGGIFKYNHIFYPLLTLPLRFWITKKKHEFVSNNVYSLRLYLRKLLMHRNDIVTGIHKA
ncbi:unnamed protein product, partial [Prunus brigantina]